jgi:methylated-DNA-[protein]-cysteine S-methyltransferase
MRGTLAAPALRYAAKVATAFAVLGIRTDGRAVCGVHYLSLDAPASAPTDRVAARAVREIERYLDDPAFRFTVPLAASGTPFQQRVREAVAAIPVGESRTYAEVARGLHSAARAVGQACGRNPIALIVPCHRVVGSRGALGGFMHAARGDAIAVKRWLLVHEGYRFGA